MSWGPIKHVSQNLGDLSGDCAVPSVCVFTFFLKNLRGVGVVLLLPCTRRCLWCLTKTLRVSVGMTSPFYYWELRLRGEGPALQVELHLPSRPAALNNGDHPTFRLDSVSCSPKSPAALFGG